MIYSINIINEKDADFRKLLSELNEGLIFNIQLCIIKLYETSTIVKHTNAVKKTFQVQVIELF